MGLIQILNNTRQMDIISILGMPVALNGVLLNAAVVIQNLYQPHFRLFEQKLLGKEVATSISGNAQLRKSNDLHTFPVGMEGDSAV